MKTANAISLVLYIPAKLSITDCTILLLLLWYRSSIYVICNLFGRKIYIFTYLLSFTPDLSGRPGGILCVWAGPMWRLAGGQQPAAGLTSLPGSPARQPSNATPSSASSVCEGSGENRYICNKQCGTPWALREITNSIVGPLPQQSDELPHHLFRIQVGYGSALIYMISLRTR